MDLRRAGAVALTVFSYIARVCAILLGLLTVLLCFPVTHLLPLLSSRIRSTTSRARSCIFRSQRLV